jgi:hypothetical protein
MGTVRPSSPSMTIFIANLLLCLPMGLLFWLIGFLMAPSGSSISFKRGVAASGIICMWIFASEHLLWPLLGDWHVLVDLAATAVIAKLLFGLTLMRSSVCTVLFWSVFCAAWYILVIRQGQSSQRSNHPGAASLATMRCCRAAGQWREVAGRSRWAEPL